MAMATIEQRLAAVKNRIHEAEKAAKREPGSVRLLAVSKAQPPEALIAAYRAGQRNFGENYLQESTAKMACLPHPDIVWHFIGPIQSNKTRGIASRLAWVQSVDRLSIAERLSAQRPAHMPPLNVCIQVNVSGEATKAGITCAELPDLMAAVARLPGLHVRGLMAIPAPTSDAAEQRRAFQKMREAFDKLSAYSLDTLSMGMSEDLEAAIMEGATMVRVGTAIFGPRTGRDDVLRDSDDLR
jgi:pyridoxal phosphate enzyme (YggS family)